MSRVDDFLSHLSEQPWSNFTEADYTLEQWHRACLIHLHDGPPTSKSQCKLPVKTPNGAVNRAGVFAATAALAGARSPLQAPADQKAKAAAALRGYYAQMGKKPPPSLAQSAISKILTHYGTRGMRWGVRKREPTKESSDYKKIAPLRKKKPHELTNKQLKSLNERLNLERQHKQLNPSVVRKGKTQVEFILGTVGLGVTAYAMVHSPAGKALLNLGRRKAYQQLRLFK